jgi:hypothetical protein
MLKDSRSMTIKLVLALIFCLTACGCHLANRRPFYEWVRESCERNRPCTIRLKNYTGFEWDKVYVFAPQVMEYEIKEVLGQSYPISGEYGYKLVFLKGNKIVHQFESPTYVSEDEKGRIIFMDLPNAEIFKVYEGPVTFNVEQQEGNGSVETNYLLTCEKCK